MLLVRHERHEGGMGPPGTSRRGRPLPAPSRTCPRAVDNWSLTGFFLALACGYLRTTMYVRTAESTCMIAPVHVLEASKLDGKRTENAAGGLLPPCSIARSIAIKLPIPDGSPYGVVACKIRSAGCNSKNCHQSKRRLRNRSLLEQLYSPSCDVEYSCANFACAVLPTILILHNTTGTYCTFLRYVIGQFSRCRRPSSTISSEAQQRLLCPLLMIEGLHARGSLL